MRGRRDFHLLADRKTSAVECDPYACVSLVFLVRGPEDRLAPELAMRRPRLVALARPDPGFSAECHGPAFTDVFDDHQRLSVRRLRQHLSKPFGLSKLVGARKRRHLGPDPRRVDLARADLEDIGLHAFRKWHDFDAAVGLDLAVACMDLDRQDRGDLCIRPPARTKAGSPAQHDQAGSLLYCLRQEVNLLACQSIRGQISQNKGVVSAGGEVRVRQRIHSGRARRRPQHFVIDLNVGRRIERSGQVRALPGQFRALKVQDRKASFQHRYICTDFIITGDELSVFMFDLEGDFFLAGGFGKVFQTVDQNELFALFGRTVFLAAGLGLSSI